MLKEYKVLFCCGSRPEFIKVSPVYDALKAIPHITPILCNTGQHQDLLLPHLKSLHMTPDYQLSVMRDNQSLDQLMAHLFDQLPSVFDNALPDLVIIQGDTASALAAAIIAHDLGYPVAHIEAGLRTYNTSSPFPEEVYRQSISKVANWHFCPTEKAKENLLQEHIIEETVFVTGNTSIDMILRFRDNTENTNSHKSRPYFLITLHRRESQGAPLIAIANSILNFSRSHLKYDFIIPLHPNPATSKLLRNLLGKQSNIKIITPVPYPEFVPLMANAFAIVTDSGGVQEEAPSLNTPVIVVRDVTERQEGVESGCLRLAGTSKNTILEELNLLIEDQEHYKRMQEAPNPFGDGHAAMRIKNHIATILERNC